VVEWRMSSIMDFVVVPRGVFCIKPRVDGITTEATRHMGLAPSLHGALLFVYGVTSLVEWNVHNTYLGRYYRYDIL
jgi:hypothetical protein